VIEGVIVASIGWHGFRESDGRPAVALSREAFLDRMEDLAWAYVRPASDRKDEA